MVVLSPLAVIGVPACTAFLTLIAYHRFINILGVWGASPPSKINSERSEGIIQRSRV